MEKKDFYYGGHTFVGTGQLNPDMSFKDISSEIYSVLLDDKSEGIDKWNHDDFYKEAEKAGAGDMDLFRMDDKYMVIPCSHFLAIYGKESHQLYTVMAEINKGLNDLSCRKKELFHDALELVIKCLHTKKDNVWDFEAEEFSLSTSLYCNGYIEAEVKKVYLKEGVLTLVDGVSGEHYNEDDGAFTLDCLLDILNVFCYS